ncbi:MAG: 2Fe-2S iron-sulfur cluster-binding protein [Thermacetogeniaceae bacterium]
MSKPITLTIDDKQVEAKKGERLLWAALDNGIYIPHLCDLRKAGRTIASCRLCFVEIEGLPNPVTSCTQMVSEGMVVRTRTPRVDRLVRTGFELLLSNHRLHCAKCAKNKCCELQKIAKERGLKLKLNRLRSLVKEVQIDESPSAFCYDSSKCVLCGRCIWADQEQVKVGAIGFIRRGIDRKVATFEDGLLADSICTQCEACVKICPVGALYLKEDEHKLYQVKKEC